MSLLCGLAVTVLQLKAYLSGGGAASAARREGLELWDQPKMAMRSAAALRARSRLVVAIFFFLGACLLVADGFIPPVGSRVAGVVAGNDIGQWKREARSAEPRILMRAAPRDEEEELLLLESLMGANYDSDDEEESLGPLLELLEIGDATRAQMGETPLLKILSGHVRETDPLFANMGGRSWADLLAKARGEYIERRVEGKYHQERLAVKLEGLFDSLLEYVERYAILKTVLYPAVSSSPDDDEDANPVGVDPGRVDVYSEGYDELVSLRGAYLKAHVAFWSDLTSVLKSQEDIPAAGFRVASNDVTSDLPAPFGTGDSGIVLLPVPQLLEWKANDFGGVEDQIADLMALKAMALPEIEAMRMGRGAREALHKYTEVLSQRFWRKGPRWPQRDAAARAYVDALNGRGKVVPTDPATTGIRVAGVANVQRRGMEDEWLQQE